MLTIVCGEDTVASRKYYQALKDQYKAKNQETQSILPKEIHEQIIKSDQTMNLFGGTLVFFTENLNSYLGRATSKKNMEVFENLAKDKTVDIIDWEEGKTTRDLKIAKLGTVKECKVDKSIFQLLDACYPKNKTHFVKLLNDLVQTSDEVFIYTMLVRHIRTLMLAQAGSFSARVQPWQRGKIASQAGLWKENKLIGFYDGLFRIDIGMKTSSNPFGVKKSLDILACYYL